MKILMDAPTKINGGLTTHTNGIFQAALINPDINILGIDFSRDVLKPQTISKGAAGKKWNYLEAICSFLCSKKIQYPRYPISWELYYKRNKTLSEVCTRNY